MTFSELIFAMILTLEVSVQTHADRVADRPLVSAEGARCSVERLEDTLALNDFYEEVGRSLLNAILRSNSMVEVRHATKQAKSLLEMRASQYLAKHGRRTCLYNSKGQDRTLWPEEYIRIIFRDQVWSPEQIVDSSQPDCPPNVANDWEAIQASLEDPVLRNLKQLIRLATTRSDALDSRAELLEARANITQIVSTYRQFRAVHPGDLMCNVSRRDGSVQTVDGRQIDQYVDTLLRRLDEAARAGQPSVPL